VLAQTLNHAQSINQSIILTKCNDEIEMTNYGVTFTDSQ